MTAASRSVIDRTIKCLDSSIGQSNRLLIDRFSVQVTVKAPCKYLDFSEKYFAKVFFYSYIIYIRKIIKKARTYL